MSDIQRDLLKLPERIIKSKINITNYYYLILITSAGYSKRGVSDDQYDCELRDITNSEVTVNSCEASEASPTAERNLVVRSSLISKLPPMLIIKSANLRILDPIGQGNLNYSSHSKHEKINKIVA